MNKKIDTEGNKLGNFTDLRRSNSRDHTCINQLC